MKKLIDIFFKRLNDPVNIFIFYNAINAFILENIIKIKKIFNKDKPYFIHITLFILLEINGSKNNY